jgi:hypothetical protein
MHSGRMSTWGLRGTMAAVGISAVVAGVGGAAIYAATDDGHHIGGMPGGFGSPSQNHVGGPPRDPMPAQESSALHGVFVVADGAGGFTTVLSQTGRVTAISPTPVTARSDDGFSQTYLIPALGPAAMNAPPFVLNDAVTIHATRTGDTASVTTIDYARTGGDPAGPPPVSGHR